MPQVLSSSITVAAPCWSSAITATVRGSERAKSLDAAGRVEGRLMLVLVLCYLPALMLLVVIPLFLGLLDGLFV